MKIASASSHLPSSAKPPHPIPSQRQSRVTTSTYYNLIRIVYRFFRGTKLVPAPEHWHSCAVVPPGPEGPTKSLNPQIPSIYID